MSLWDQFDLLKAADAAELAFPANASEAKALLTKMQKSYEKALAETASIRRGRAFRHRGSCPLTKSHRRVFTSSQPTCIRG